MDRLEQLRLFLTKQDFEVVVLTKPANIAAFFRGAQALLEFRQEPSRRIAICVTEASIVLVGNQTEVIGVAYDELSWLHGFIASPYILKMVDNKIYILCKIYESFVGTLGVYNDSNKVYYR
jgi:hypothetical protein